MIHKTKGFTSSLWELPGYRCFPRYFVIVSALFLSLVLLSSLVSAANDTCASYRSQGYDTSASYFERDCRAFDLSAYVDMGVTYGWAGGAHGDEYECGIDCGFWIPCGEPPTPTPTDPPHDYCAGYPVDLPVGAAVTTSSGALYQPVSKTLGGWTYSFSPGTYYINGNAVTVVNCDITPPTVTPTLPPVVPPTIAPTPTWNPVVPVIPGHTPNKVTTLATLDPAGVPTFDVPSIRDTLNQSVIGNVSAPYFNFIDSVGARLLVVTQMIIGLLTSPLNWLASSINTVTAYFCASVMAFVALSQLLLSLASKFIDTFPEAIISLVALYFAWDTIKLALDGD